MSRRRGRTSLDERASRTLSKEYPDIEYILMDRQQVCRTEINAAIRLFLFQEDLIPALVLASAASEVMTALAKDEPGIGFNDVRELLKSIDASPDLEKEVIDSLLHPYNFLKHGSSDASITNEFSVEHIIIVLYGAVHGYKKLFKDASIEMKMFYRTVQLCRCHWWATDDDYETKQRIVDEMGVHNAPMNVFCALGRDMIENARRTSEAPS